MKKTKKMEKTKQMKTDGETGARKAPEFAPIVAGYLAGEYEPMDWRRPGEGPTECSWVLRCSQELQLELAEMADLELNDVATAMLWLGYRTATSEGKTGWLMKVL